MSISEALREVVDARGDGEDKDNAEAQRARRNAEKTQERQKERGRSPLRGNYS